MDNLCLNTAKDALCIKSVNLRHSSLDLRSELEVSELEQAEIIPQSFRWVKQVREYEEEQNNSDDVSWQYKFNFEAGVRLVPNEDEEESLKEEPYDPLIQIMAGFQAIYVSKTRLDEEQLNAFSENNVGFNVWPYWRELVQSYCCRIGLHPPIEIPLYILSKDK